MTSPASTTASVSYNLEAPESWETLPRLLTIRGWAFLPDAGAVTGVRARLGTTVVAGSVAHHRPDVRAAFPEAPDDYTGFQIAARAPSGRCPVELQLRTASTDWTTFYTGEASSPRWQRPLALGGGSAADLLAGQLSLVPAYPPRPLKADRSLAGAYPLPTETERPNVAMVVPSFNQARWLRENIQSIHGDRVPGLKIVVRDGGSTDGSRSILEELDPLLHDWRSEPDGGQAAAVRDGFDAIANDLEPDDVMAWLNSDDRLMPGALGLVQRYFATHPETDVVYGNRVIIDDDSHEIGRWHLPPHKPAVLRLYDFVPQETLFWRKRAWDRVGGVDVKLRFALDWDLLLRFQEAGLKLVHLPRFLGAFRVHAAQKSSAEIGAVGQAEIDQLRARTHGQAVGAEELLNSTDLQNYLRRSARLELLYRCGFRPGLPR